MSFFEARFRYHVQVQMFCWGKRNGMLYHDRWHLCVARGKGDNGLCVIKQGVMPCRVLATTSPVIVSALHNISSTTVPQNLLHFQRLTNKNNTGSNMEGLGKLNCCLPCYQNDLPAWFIVCSIEFSHLQVSLAVGSIHQNC